MKKIKIPILIALGCYLGLAFILNEFNTTLWDMYCRVIFLLISAAFTWIYYISKT